ncbi:MAG: hypothetical protein F6J87_14835 [Spirulina sp. SIO3F2]|nr:hypothetical protein [Spirulina sp. SIO3F2]
MTKFTSTWVWAIVNLQTMAAFITGLMELWFHDQPRLPAPSPPAIARQADAGIAGFLNEILPYKAAKAVDLLPRLENGGVGQNQALQNQ